MTPIVSKTPSPRPVRSGGFRSPWWVAAVATSAAWPPGAASAALTSANYRIEPTAFSGGASIASSAHYTSFAALSGSVVGTSASTAYTVHDGFFPSAGPVDVTGRFVFYNQSAWDGNNAAANAGDDAAIASDKVALLPGGTATFANYTSYSRGLNGILVDLPNGAVPTVSDFTFKKGNNNTPSGWAAGPVPSSVTVRAGAGVGGADRVTLIWPNTTSVKKEWLEVTVLPTVTTGLAEADTFYFGNAIGETGVGNSTSRFPVTSADVLTAINGPITSGAPITAVTDHNRDGRVNSVDPLISINNAAVGSLALIKLTLGSGDAALAAAVSADVADAPADGAAPSSPRFLGAPERFDDRVQLWIAGPGGSQVRVEHADALATGIWEPVPTDWLIEHEAGVLQLVVPQSGPQRFFRLRPVGIQSAD